MIETLYLVPCWFSSIDAVLEIIFTVITLLVAIRSFRIYNITKEKEIGLFSTAFFLLSLSYMMRLLHNTFFIRHHIGSQEIMAINNSALHVQLTIWAYVIFFLGAYITLSYETLKISGKRAYFLLLVPSLIAYFLSKEPSLTLYSIASFFLFSVIYSHLNHYNETKDKRILPILLSFMILLMSNLFFIAFVQDLINYHGYIIASILEFISYSIIAFTLYGTTKKKRKKK